MVLPVKIFLFKNILLKYFDVIALIIFRYRFLIYYLAHFYQPKARLLDPTRHPTLLMYQNVIVAVIVYYIVTYCYIVEYNILLNIVYC